MALLDTRHLMERLSRWDWGALLLQLLLLMAGVLFIRVAGMEYGGAYPSRWKMQIFWIILGFGLYFFLALHDYRQLALHSRWLYCVGLFLLLLTLLFGSYVNGSRCVLKVREGLTLQVSEVVKPLMLLCCSWVLSRPILNYMKIPRLLVWAALIFPPFLLILLEPDCGTALVYLPFSFAILFLNRLRWREIWILLLVGILSLPLLYLQLKPYQKLRMIVFARTPAQVIFRGMAVISPRLSQSCQQIFEGEIERLGERRGNGHPAMEAVPNTQQPTGPVKLPEFQAKNAADLDDWNVRQALASVGSGGLTGVGYGQGIQHTLGYLPRYVAPTDFIFSVIAEESGFLGTVLLLLMELGVILLACRTALQANDALGSSIAAGGAVIYATHLLVNAGMNLGWMPVIGIPLPFVSYGGSFMLGMLGIAGLIQSVHLHRNPKEKYAENHDN